MKFFFSNWSSGPARIIIVIIIILIYFTSKIYNSVVNQKKLKMLIKFDEKEYWCELFNVTNISYKP